MTKSRELRPLSFLLLPCLLLLSACAVDSASESSPPELTGPVTTTEYQKNSCVHGFDEGNGQVPAKPAEEVATTFFRKSVDRARLSAVSELSARATAEFMRADGVDVYYVPVSVSRNSCSHLSGLGEASGGLFNLWKAVDGDDGGVLGLFLPVNRVREQGATRPVIMVRPDTDRYTLVHEYMHFVFNDLRERRGYSDERFLAEFERAQKAYDAVDALTTTSSREKVVAYMTAWLGFTAKLVELTENFALEEMTIEALLTEATRGGSLKHVTEFNRKNSVEYIRSSASTAAQIYRAISDDFEKVLKLARQHEMTDAVTTLETMAKRILANMEDMESIKTKYATSRSAARVASLRSGHLPSGVIGAEGSTEAAFVPHDHTKCGRQVLLEKLGGFDGFESKISR